WLTAEANLAVADPKLGIGLEDAYDAVLADTSERLGRSRTFATLTTDPQTGCTKVSGTMRLMLGLANEANLASPALDALNFVEAVEGWPHEREGLRDAPIGEMGRFFLAERYRTLEMRRAGVDLWLGQQLYEAVSDLARRHQVRLLYIVMAPNLARLF